MQARWRYIPEVLTLMAAIWVQFRLAGWLLESRLAGGSERLRHWIRMATLGCCLWLFFGFAFSIPAHAGLLPNWQWLAFLRAGAMLWAICSTGAVILYPLWKGVERFNPERRRALVVLRNTLAVAPLAAAGYGTFLERNRFHVRETRVPVRGLAPGLNGLLLVQLTDVHLGAFLSLKDLQSVVDMANETRAQLAVFTGDLITTAGDPLEAGLQQLARLRADAGVWGCLGNHEIYANAENLAAQWGARLGIGFLRRASHQLKFGGATLNLAGVDYQRLRAPYLRGAARLIVPQAANILLSHNPDVFPVAAAQGWDLVLAGHTHGGQISVEILGENLSIARLYTPYVYGLYRSETSAIYVSRGLGTVGVPTRVGAPPEVSLIRLCAI